MAREASHDQDVENKSFDKKQTNSFSNDAIIAESDRASKSKKAHRKCNQLTKANSRLKQIQDAQKSICPICGTLQKYMRQHMIIHTGDRRFECTYCKKRFLQLGCLKTHLNIHTGNKPFSCNHCDKCFSDASGLRLHKVFIICILIHWTIVIKFKFLPFHIQFQLSHSEDRNYTCEICQKKFRYTHNLSQHRRTHTQERRHRCEYCQGAFLTTSALKKHVMLHTGERKFKCDICTKGFITNYNLNIHRKVHFKKTTKLATIDDSQLMQAKSN